MDLDLLDGDFYAGDPYPTYAWLREEAPLYWDATNELWAVARYDDVLEIEKRKDVFVSSDTAKGGYRPNLPADTAIIGLDDPLHQKRRNLVARRFTPRAVTEWEDDIRAKVTSLLDAVEAHGGADTEIVTELAAPLPAMMIGKLLGFGEEAWPELQQWSERTIAMGGGPRYFSEAGLQAVVEFRAAAGDLLEARRACPADDVMGVWAHAEVEGRPVTDDDVLADCLLLLDGGAETTRTVIARTILQLIASPDQWQRLRNGADVLVAAEEFIRYTTPIHNMCRVATRDHEIAGGVIGRGEQVLMMYSAANRDPAHFVEPERYDVTRDPNPHIAFGFGTHFCLGAALARLEIRIFFEEFVRRVGSIRLTPGTAPEEMPNAFVYGLASARVDLEFA